MANKTFPFERSFPREPPIEYNQLRNEHPIHRCRLNNGNKVCLISQFGDVCLVLGDDEHFRQVNSDKHGQFLNLDPSKHLIYRQIIEKEFSMDRMKESESQMKKIVDYLLNEFIDKNPPVDFVSQFAVKVSPLILYDLLGIHQRDYQFLNNHIQSSTISPELSDYIHRLIDNKKQTPGTDIISRLITEQVRTGKINQDELLNIIFLLLLRNGNEAIENFICLGLISLLEDKDQWGKLRDDISLMDNTVEEILRYYTGLSFLTRRSTIKDLEISGEMVKTGEDVFALNASANRDEKVFTNADRFDICRPPQHHLSFGYGIHQCIAMHLVRTQLKVVFTCIFQRLPNLQLDQSNDNNIQYVNDSNKDIGVLKLMVKW